MSGVSWNALVLTGGPPSQRWEAIFNAVRRLLESDGDASQLEQTLDAGDRLLADAAWELWQSYGDAAPPASLAVRQWWTTGGTDGPGPYGRAVLVLDAGSVREARLILAQAKERGVAVERAGVYGSGVPSDTQAFARALGLTGRSQLQQGNVPAGFVLSGTDLYTELCQGQEFGQVAADLPPARDIVLWHPWLDDLLHQQADKSNAVAVITRVARQALSGDGFWRLIDQLRTGRRLLVTSDHGYALSGRFAELPREYGDRLRTDFGARRYSNKPVEPHVFVHGQSVTVQAGGRTAVIGPWKWRVSGGFPYASHGGLTLAEVCVPVIELAAL